MQSCIAACQKTGLKDHNVDQNMFFSIKQVHIEMCMAAFDHFDYLLNAVVAAASSL